MVRTMGKRWLRKALLEFLVDAINWHLAELRITIYELRIFKFGGSAAGEAKPHPVYRPRP